MTESLNDSALQERIDEIAQQVDQLRKEKEGYRTFFDSLTACIREIDIDGTILYANTAHHQLYGYDGFELIGRNAYDLSLTKKERQNAVVYFNSLVNDRPAPTPWFSKDKKKDGTIMDVRVDWNYTTNQFDEVIGFISLVSEIKRQKDQQGNLDESGEKFQSIFEHSPLAIMHADENGTITACNDNASRVFGAPKEKLIGFSYKDIRNDAMRKAIGSALVGKQSQFEGEYLSVTGNVLIQMKAVFNPAFRDDGTVSGIIGIFEDMTKSILATKEKTQRKAQFEAIFHSISDAAVFVDQQRCIVLVNRAFTKIFGYKNEEVVGRSSHFIYANPDDHKDQGEKRYHVDARVESSVYEIDYRRKDGTTFPSETLGGEVKDENGKSIGFVGIIRDISERKKIENYLRESEKKFKSVIDSTPMGVHMYKLEPDGRLIFIGYNQAANDIL